MRKLFLLVILIPVFAFGQDEVYGESKKGTTYKFEGKIKERIDDFTNAKVKETNWEVLIYRSKLLAYTKIRHINDQLVLNLKLVPYIGPFSIDKGENIMLKLANDSIVRLNVPQYTISGRGDGSISIVSSGVDGVYVSIKLSKDQQKALLESPITKIRAYTTKGTYFENDIKKYNTTIISELIKAVL